MPFITEIPDPQEVAQYRLGHLLNNRFQTWTVDKSVPAFLIFQQEQPDALYKTREDFYFHLLDHTLVASFGLKLQPQDNGGLLFHWYLLSSYGLSRFPDSQPVMLAVDDEGSYTGVVDPDIADQTFNGYHRQSVLTLLKEAFVCYKTYYGFQAGSSQSMMVDESRLVVHAEEHPLIILPDGRVMPPTPHSGA